MTVRLDSGGTRLPRLNSRMPRAHIACWNHPSSFCLTRRTDRWADERAVAPGFAHSCPWHGSAPPPLANDAHHSLNRRPPSATAGNLALGVCVVVCVFEEGQEDMGCWFFFFALFFVKLTSIYIPDKPKFHLGAPVERTYSVFQRSLKKK